MPPDSQESREPVEGSQSTLDRLPEWAVVVAVALFAGLLGTLALVSTPPIAPSVTDEFSVLLGADTFAQGRLTNPTPAHWEFFEAPHVFFEPTYQSKYQPGRALFAALGMVVFGTPFAGQVILQMLFAASLYWGLRAVFPRAWALGGVLIALPFFGIYSYMSLTFFGGLLSGTGGALVFGGSLRLTPNAEGESRLPVSGVLMALGAVALMFSRPYEGVVACVIPGGLILWRFIKLGDWRRVQFWRGFLLPFAFIMAAAFLLQAIYNHAVTGSTVVMPYQVYSEQYELADSLFIGAKMREDVVFQQEFLERAFLAYLGPRLAEDYNPLSRWPSKIVDMTRVWMGLTAWILLPVGLIAGRRQGAVWISSAHVLLGLVAILFSFAFQPHYAAPFYLGLLVLMLSGVRGLAEWRLPRLWRTALVGLLTVLIGVALFRQVSWQLESIPLEDEMNLPMIRRDMENRLTAQPGEDLVFVRHTVLPRIWVYNSADIAAQHVIWAWDMGSEKNRELLDSYPDRRPWLMVAGEGVRMIPYPAEEVPTSPADTP